MIGKREVTYIMIKPDGVQRGLVGKIIDRFEKKGFKLIALKLMTPTKVMKKEMKDGAGMIIFSKWFTFFFFKSHLC